MKKNLFVSWLKKEVGVDPQDSSLEVVLLRVLLQCCNFLLKSFERSIAIHFNLQIDGFLKDCLLANNM